MVVLDQHNLLRLHKAWEEVVLLVDMMLLAEAHLTKVKTRATTTPTRVASKVVMT